MYQATCPRKVGLDQIGCLQWLVVQGLAMEGCWRPSTMTRLGLNRLMPDSSLESRSSTYPSALFSSDRGDEQVRRGRGPTSGVAPQPQGRSLGDQEEKWADGPLLSKQLPSGGSTCPELSSKKKAQIIHMYSVLYYVQACLGILASTDT